MLPHEMLVPLGIFALLESGCSEVWRNGETLIGVEQGDPDNQVNRRCATACADMPTTVRLVVAIATSSLVE
jgi:hypothetical protein